MDERYTQTQDQPDYRQTDNPQPDYWQPEDQQRFIEALVASGKATAAWRDALITALADQRTKYDDDVVEAKSTMIACRAKYLACLSSAEAVGVSKVLARQDALYERYAHEEAAELRRQQTLAAAEAALQFGQDLAGRAMRATRIEYLQAAEEEEAIEAARREYVVDEESARQFGLDPGRLFLLTEASD